MAFEVKYRSSPVTRNELKGLREFAEKYKVDRAYVITGRADDLGEMSLAGNIQVVRIPAWLACYWLSASEKRE